MPNAHERGDYCHATHDVRADEAFSVDARHFRAPAQMAWLDGFFLSRDHYATIAKPLSLLLRKRWRRRHGSHLSPLTRLPCAPRHLLPKESGDITPAKRSLARLTMLRFHA